MAGKQAAASAACGRGVRLKLRCNPPHGRAHAHQGVSPPRRLHVAPSSPVFSPWAVCSVLVAKGAAGVHTQQIGTQAPQAPTSPFCRLLVWRWARLSQRRPAVVTVFPHSHTRLTPVVALRTFALRTASANFPQWSPPLVACQPGCSQSPMGQCPPCPPGPKRGLDAPQNALPSALEPPTQRIHLVEPHLVSRLPRAQHPSA